VIQFRHLSFHKNATWHRRIQVGTVALKILLLTSICCLGGCAATPSIFSEGVESVTYYQHPDVGSVTAEDPAYKNMVADCEKKTFTHPVNIDGRLVESRDELSAIWNTYYVRTMWQIYQDEKRLAAAEAAADGKSGQSEQPSSGKISQQQAEAVFNQMRHPGYYAEIRQLLDRNTRCIREESGWRPVRTDYIVIETGKVIKSVDLKPDEDQ